jgi:hypothetical protein
MRDCQLGCQFVVFLASCLMKCTWHLEERLPTSVLNCHMVPIPRRKILMANINFQEHCRRRLGWAALFKVLLINLIICAYSRADSLADPFAHIVASPKGKAYFLCMPPQRRSGTIGRGKAFLVSKGGESIEKWSVSGL